MNHKEFKSLMQMQMDCVMNGTGHMLLYFGFSIYFILALSGDYDVPVYMANLSAAIAMAFVFMLWCALPAGRENTGVPCMKRLGTSP